jgi:hypothetical protein
MAKASGGTPSVSFPKGGSGKMFGKQIAGAQQPGVTSHEVSSNGDFAKGGSKHMFGKGHADKMPEQVTARKSQ